MAEYIDRVAVIEAIMSEPTDAHDPSWYAEKIKEIPAADVEPVRKWIPVSDRKPDLIRCNAGTAYSEAVMILTSCRKVITAIYDGTDWIGPFGFWDAEGEEITHWTPVLLPLPEPLEDGTV